MSRPITEKRIQEELFRTTQATGVGCFSNRHVPRWYEADFMRITPAGYWAEYEIKLSLADYHADFKKGGGWKHKKLETGAPCGPKHFIFVLPLEIAENIGPPPYAGLMGVTKNRSWLKFHVLKKPPVLKASKKLTPAQIITHYRALHFRYWHQRNKKSV